MDSCNSIIVSKDYGHISLKLKELMDLKGVSRYGLAKSANTRFEVIDKWYNNKVEKIDLDVLARICFVLDCKIDDILSYEISNEQ